MTRRMPRLDYGRLRPPVARETLDAPRMAELRAMCERWRGEGSTHAANDLSDWLDKQ